MLEAQQSNNKRMSSSIVNSTRFMICAILLSFLISCTEFDSPLYSNSSNLPDSTNVTQKGLEKDTIVTPKLEYIWLKANTHTHTTMSDGTIDPKSIADSYKNAGYQFLFITDHNFITDVNQLSSPNFLCLSGVEFTFNKHINGLGIDKYTTPISCQQSIDFVEKQGGITTLNHPLYAPNGICSRDILVLQNLELMEIYNGITESWGFHDNQKLWDTLLTEGKLIYGIASDDTHRTSDIGRGWIMVYASELQKDTLLQAIKKGRFYSSTGIEFTKIEVTKTLLSIYSTNAQKIKFIGASGSLLKIVEEKNASYSITGKEPYVRVEAINDNGHKAWTQPLVWKGKSIYL